MCHFIYRLPRLGSDPRLPLASRFVFPSFSFFRNYADFFARVAAEVVDLDDKDTPKIFAPSARPNNWEDKVPVYFFAAGGNRTGFVSFLSYFRSFLSTDDSNDRNRAWVARSAVHELGENDEYDQLLLDPLHVKSVRQGKVTGAKLAAEVEKLVRLASSWLFSSLASSHDRSTDLLLLHSGVQRECYDEAKEKMETDDEAEEPSTTKGMRGTKVVAGKGGKEKKVVKRGR